MVNTLTIFLSFTWRYL